MNAGETDRLTLLLVRFLRLSFRLALEESLLQHQRVLNILLAQAVEALVESRYTISLSTPIAFDPTPETIHDRLSLGGEYLTHTRCLTHLLLQLQLLAGYVQLAGRVQVVNAGRLGQNGVLQIVYVVGVVNVGVRSLAHADRNRARRGAGGALRGLAGQEPPGLHTAP